MSSEADGGRDGVLDHLEAGDQAEFALRSSGAGERIVVGDVGEAMAAMRSAKAPEPEP